MVQSVLANLRASFAPAGGWPAERIVGALKRRYEKVSLLGKEQNFTLYGVEDRGVNFVVALVGVEGAQDRIAEIAFLARFVNYEVSSAALDQLNRNLHISVVGMDEGGDLFLLAGVQITGAYDEATLSLLLDAWRRDLMLVLQVLSGRASVAHAFPLAKNEAALKFAVNSAGKGADGDVLASYLSASIERGFCGDCGGRGRRGLIARACESCEGTGFVKKRRAHAK